MGILSQCSMFAADFPTKNNRKVLEAPSRHDQCRSYFFAGMNVLCVLVGVRCVCVGGGGAVFCGPICLEVGEKLFVAHHSP